MATIVNVTKSGRKTPLFTLAKGDARTKRVQFVIPRDDAGVPLDELTWRIVIKNAVGEQDGTALTKEVHGDHIDLWWTCGYIAANAVGLTTIYLNAFNEDGKMQWSSGEYCIHVIPAKEDEQEEGNGLSELQELIESARQAMENATQDTIAATQSAIEAVGSANEAANTAEIAAENAGDAADGANDSAIRADEAAESADKAKEVGGIGPCGRTLCCSNYLVNFDSVSINMAKNQNVSLNPSKINGVCVCLICLRKKG